MSRNILVTITISLMLVYIGCGLRTYEQPVSNLYDANQYKVKLQTIETQYRKKAQILNQQLDYINDLIADKTITKKQKIMKLSESMADQRDTLYEIQKIVKIPYNIKLCQCIEISQADKNQLLEKINKLNSTISQLELSVKDCQGDNCAKTKQMKTSIQSMKGYLDSLKQIVDSDCCRKPLYMPPEKATGLVDLNQTLVIDNLQSIWSYQGHPRLINNQYYVEVTSKDRYKPFRFEITTKFNTTNCPQDKPFANFDNNTCFRCNLTCFKFDLINRTCYSCNESLIAEQCKVQEGEHYDNQTNACEKCPQNEEYSKYYHKCQKCKPNQFLNKYWKCQDCDYGMYYNTELKKCDYCPGRRYFSSEQNKCVRCPQNTELNITTLQCEPCKQDQHYNSTIGICSKCQDDSIYSKQQKRCIHKLTHKTCPRDVPHYNEDLGKCEQCPIGTIFIRQLNRCVRNNKIGICPPENPNYNYLTHQCETCPEGTFYNKYYMQCDPIVETEAETEVESS